MGNRPTVFLTNELRSFQFANVTERVLSDSLRLIPTFLKSFILRLKPENIYNRKGLTSKTLLLITGETGL